MDSEIRESFKAWWRNVADPHDVRLDADACEEGFLAGYGAAIEWMKQDLIGPLTDPPRLPPTGEQMNAALLDGSTLEDRTGIESKP